MSVHHSTRFWDKYNFTKLGWSSNKELAISINPPPSSVGPLRQPHILAISRHETNSPSTSTSSTAPTAAVP
jgi:hypothetical protein